MIVRTVLAAATGAVLVAGGITAVRLAVPEGDGGTPLAGAAVDAGPAPALPPVPVLPEAAPPVADVQPLREAATRPERGPATAEPAPARSASTTTDRPASPAPPPPAAPTGQAPPVVTRAVGDTGDAGESAGDDSRGGTREDAGRGTRDDATDGTDSTDATDRTDSTGDDSRDEPDRSEDRDDRSLLGGVAGGLLGGLTRTSCGALGAGC